MLICFIKYLNSNSGNNQIGYCIKLENYFSIIAQKYVVQILYSSFKALANAIRFKSFPKNVVCGCIRLSMVQKWSQALFNKNTKLTLTHSTCIFNRIKQRASLEINYN